MGLKRTAPLRTDCRGLARESDGLWALAQPGLGLHPLTGTWCKLEQGAHIAGQAAGGLGSTLTRWVLGDDLHGCEALKTFSSTP